jgi:hypothetical protein
MSDTYAAAAAILAITACTTEPAPAPAPVAASPKLPAPHPSARFLTGTWQRFDAQGQLTDRWELTPSGTFSIWTKVEGGGQFFADFSDVSGTYTATDRTLSLTGTTREGWPFLYDTGYFADEHQFIRAPFVMTEISDSESTWSGSDYLIVYPTVSAYPFDDRMEPTLTLHVADSGPGKSELRWNSYPGYEAGMFKLVGDVLSLDTHGEITTFDLVDPGTLAQRVDDPWMRGLSLIGFYHPRTLGLRYLRASPLLSASVLK